ncbi:MAG: PIN domain-containing protein [Eubacterium sp.]|jgi:flagellar biosynthesis GTPase FlhF|nr:PIN domain-containing protein [Eubacterium sp.]MCH4047089.1 PIN domain-containing protein [Eubacterium sp.]MCH4080186.1 PIN domain-containing protein [Eubacterium sp.]MCH4110973.1 PIN domain-containing protein [Eubacterium sp.]MCI1306817.1 PIN domain-containing protein [Eubacterium sp.]
MKYFFIDYENIKQDALKGIERLSEEDKVIVFYSEYAQTMTIPMHLQINNSRAEFSFKEVQVGHKNDLDFQLATELGALVGSGMGDEFYIVSYDKGYQSVCRYWQEKNVCVKRIESLGEGCPKKKAAPKSKKKQQRTEPEAFPDVFEEEFTELQETEEEEKPIQKQKKQQKQRAKKRPPKSQKQKKKDTLLSLVKEVVPDHHDAKRVADILWDNESKQDVNNALMKEFPSPENRLAAQLYKLVKPLIPAHKDKE